MNSKTKLSLSFGAVFLSALLLVAPIAHAATPALSLSATGDGDSVQVNIAGADPNTSALLNYSKIGTGLTFVSLGTTDGNGNLAVTISSSQNGIVSGENVYVTTGGINGPQSSQIAWPTVTSTSTSNNLSLSPGALILSTGQSATVTADESSLNVTSNSNSSVANFSTNGNQIIVTTVNYGAALATICSTSNTSDCQNLYVLVQASASSLSFSQNPVNLSQGQSISVNISGGTNSYNIMDSSNPNNVIGSSISGQTVTLTGNSSGGSSSITICSTDNVTCGVLNASINSSSSGSITFGNTNPTVVMGQNTTVNIYGGSGSYYVSANSNPSVLQANISGNVLTLIGNTSGSSTITVCSNSSVCNSLTATVNGNGNQTYLSQSNINLSAGQSMSITIYGGVPPYNLSSSNGNIFSISLSGNMLTLYGVGAGSSSTNVCSSAGGCATLTVNVTGSTSSNVPTLSQNSVSLSLGQSTTVYISGNGSYYVSTNSSPGVANVLINQNGAVVSAVGAGVDNVTICQSGGSCAMLTVTVPQTTTNINVYVFTRYLGYGDNGQDVLRLQQFLVQQGLLSANPTGHYGPATVAAMKRFQGAHGIRALGNMGPATENLLNQLLGSSTTSTTTRQQQILQIQQEMQQLQAQLAALEAGQ